MLLALFLRQHGLRHVLARRRQRNRTPGDALPDLFTSGKVLLERKAENRPVYLKEFIATRQLPGLAASYAALNAASRLARFMERNLTHMEVFEPAWGLVDKAFQAMASKPLPEVALLKALYLTANREGYAVRGHWLQGKKPAERQALTHVLQNPAEALAGVVESDLVEVWIDDLCRYFEQETPLEPP